jgi:hypothetical protein
MSTEKTVQQPAKITFNGKTYRRVSKQHVISTEPPITEGPFYEPASGSDGFVYLPDAAFLIGASDTVSAMHRIAAS